MLGLLFNFLFLGFSLFLGDQMQFIGLDFDQEQLIALFFQLLIRFFDFLYDG